ncbi:MAG: hypothetical protein BYD32DRAFT_138444 [Podila humilis]|nr:MAG: hypothetical protein BYD32DRAFT_138444 [Podila humilis]
MAANTFDALAQAAFATSEAVFAINSPTSQPAQAIDRLADKYTVSNTFPAVTTVQANADPFHKVVESAARTRELTSVLTTSETLLPAIPHLFKAASQRSAVVIHLETQERDKNVPAYADLMAVRQTGFAILTSDNVQSSFDLGLVAQAAAVQTSTPFLNAVNTGSNNNKAGKQSNIVLDHQRVAPALSSEQDLAAHKERQAAVSEMSLSSLYLTPKEAPEGKKPEGAVAAISGEEVYSKVEELLVALQKQTGRSYRPIEYQGRT